jgi:hypothetical protein
LLGVIEVAAARATPKTEVPHLRETSGQDMLKEASQEFDAGEAGAADLLRSIVR